VPFFCFVLLFSGCAQTDESNDEGDVTESAEVLDTAALDTYEPPQEVAPPWTQEAIDDAFLLETDEFTVPAGSERYLCYATSLEEDVAVDGFFYSAQPVVHHFLLSKTMGAEPDGFSECDVLFRFTWSPLFGAGASTTSLEIPEGAGHALKKGNRMLIQLHLLNTTTEDITDRVHIKMRRSTAEDLEPIGIYAFGTTEIDLPPGEEVAISNDCELPKDVEIVAVLPHMHTLGTSMVFETGDDPDNLEETYRIDNWSFEKQFVKGEILNFPEGTHTRTTCNFFNSSEERVTFGESTYDEMCFFVTFIKGATRPFDGCLTFTQ